MRIPQRAGRALFTALLLTGPVVLIGCSRPTASPGQQLPTQPGGNPAGYPGGSAPETEGTAPPGPGEPGYPPPPGTPTAEDPYPGMTETAAAGGGATATAAATATP